MPRPSFGAAISHWLPILGRSGIDDLRWLWREDLVLRYDLRRDFPVSGFGSRLVRESSPPFRLYYREPNPERCRQQGQAAYEAVSLAAQPLVFYSLFSKGPISYVALAGDEWVVDDSVDVHHAEWDIWYNRPTGEYGHLEIHDGPIRWWWRRLLQNRHPSDLDFLYSYKRLVAAFPSHRWPDPAPVH